MFRFMLFRTTDPEPETDDAGYSKAPKHPAFMISRRVRTVVLMVG